MTQISMSLKDSEGVIPYKPVFLGDNHGLKSSLYAINAFRRRSGKEELGYEEGLKKISDIVKSADQEKLFLLMEQWNNASVEEEVARRLLSDLPSLISADDLARYKFGSIVNFIEWSALCTIYNINFAVKYVFRDEKGNDTGSELQKWQISVPSYGAFGFPNESRSFMTVNTGVWVEPPCVFMICYSFASIQTFLPLIPKKQEIFLPGRPFLKPEVLESFDSVILAKEQGKSGKSHLLLWVHSKFSNQVLTYPTID